MGEYVDVGRSHCASHDCRTDAERMQAEQYIEPAANEHIAKPTQTTPRLCRQLLSSVFTPTGP